MITAVRKFSNQHPVWKHSHGILKCFVKLYRIGIDMEITFIVNMLDFSGSNIFYGTYPTSKNRKFTLFLTI